MLSVSNQVWATCAPRKLFSAPIYPKMYVCMVVCMYICMYGRVCTHPRTRSCKNTLGKKYSRTFPMGIFSFRHTQKKIGNRWRLNLVMIYWCAANDSGYKLRTRVGDIDNHLSPKTNTLFAFVHCSNENDTVFPGVGGGRGVGNAFKTGQVGCVSCVRLIRLLMKIGCRKKACYSWKCHDDCLVCRFIRFGQIGLENWILWFLHTIRMGL